MLMVERRQTTKEPTTRRKLSANNQRRFFKNITHCSIFRQQSSVGSVGAYRKLIQILSPQDLSTKPTMKNIIRLISFR